MKDSVTSPINSIKKLLHLEESRVRVSKNGKFWLLPNGKFHRRNGPAVILADGSQLWYIEGRRHRDNGPAVESSDGSLEWWHNDNIHREDGPAVIHSDGSKEYYINGNCISEEDFLKFIQK